MTTLPRPHVSSFGDAERNDRYLSDNLLQIPQVRTVASAATIAVPSAPLSFVTITGTTNITSVTATQAGNVAILLFQDVLTFTDGSNLKLAGNFATTADDTITLVCNGTNWYEVARSVN